jgi:hypothetical protein
MNCGRVMTTTKGINSAVEERLADAAARACRRLSE